MNTSFTPFYSSVNPSFWNKLSELKLNVYKLDESCRNIWGFYSIPNTGRLSFIEVDSTSFNKYEWVIVFLPENDTKTNVIVENSMDLFKISHSMDNCITRIQLMNLKLVIKRYFWIVKEKHFVKNLETTVF